MMSLSMAMLRSEESLTTHKSLTVLMKIILSTLPTGQTAVALTGRTCGWTQTGTTDYTARTTNLIPTLLSDTTKWQLRDLISRQKLIQAQCKRILETSAHPQSSG